MVRSKSSLNEKMYIRVTEELKNKLKVVAAERGEDVAETVRKFLEESVERHSAEDNIDFIKFEIRQAMNDVLKPHVERLAKIGAKGSVNSGTAMYLLVESLGMSGHDVVGAYTEARKKAIANLRAKEEGL